MRRGATYSAASCLPVSEPRFASCQWIGQNQPGSARFKRQMAIATDYSRWDMALTDRAARCRALLSPDTDCTRRPQYRLWRRLQQASSRPCCWPDTWRSPYEACAQRLKQWLRAISIGESLHSWAPGMTNWPISAVTSIAWRP